MSRLEICSTKEEAASKAGDCILRLLEEASREAEYAKLAVAGGSTPKLMFEHMARQAFDWENLKLFWVDERMVPPGHEQSNFSMTDEALVRPVGLRDEQVRRIHGELPPTDAAERYREEIKQSFHLKNGEMPCFDVVHLGMGADGHTASLFPNEPLIADRRGIAASVYSSSRKSYRVTLLPGVLLNARNTVFLVTGEDKAETLKAVREGPEDFQAHPAQLIDRCGKNVVWFVDAAAASALTR